MKEVYNTVIAIDKAATKAMANFGRNLGGCGQHGDLCSAGLDGYGAPLMAGGGILQTSFRLSIAPIRPVNCPLRGQPTKGNRRLYLLRYTARTRLPMRLFVLPHQ